MAKIRNSIEITLEEANGFIDHYLDLNSNTQKIYSGNFKNPKQKEDVKTFIDSLDYNSFVFDRASLERLLASKEATHIVVVMAAHNEDKIIEADDNFAGKTFKKDEFTLLSVACKEVNDQLFVVNDLGDPGTEWPPKGKALKLVKGESPTPLGGLNVNNFKFFEES